ncbi:MULTISPECIES: ECF transporter S component [Caloramator]|uniref:Energy-coupling factor transport system substrate-specific component n=1 Tax=Caloramator proteoclasticus DSM 10124 TaxID=1121262 RepID=A0A1M4V537_9CLOT|nr:MULTISPECIES: ECF transporter S component [Caloramator]SHE64012.1 energy-coupling factor transport system substrate-specific component [Caloramator proteoclasticus DSM 10124]
MNIELFINLSLILILFAAFIYFERSKMGTKEIGLIATLGAIAGVFRIPFGAIPNVQPTTFIVAVSGNVFGPFVGFLVGNVAAFVSNIFLGHGPWTIWQMFAWGLVGMLSGFIRKKIKLEYFSIICFLYGFMFDWIMNLWHIIGFIRPINIKTITIAYLSGLVFDVLHSSSNFIFSVLFYDEMYKILKRFKNRLEVTYIKEVGGDV